MLFSPQPSTKKKSSLSHASQYAIDEQHNLQFKFINNGDHTDKATINPNFHSMIDVAITHTKELNGSLKPMGLRNSVSIQFSSYDEFTSTVSSLVAKVRQWYIKETGSVKPFITVAHDVWDGNHKQINGLSIFFI